jgi:protein-export membrane protein SecD
LDEAKQLVGRLNSGALPVPIELVSTNSIGASLGGEATQAGVFAGLVGFIILSVLLIVWYRLPGIVAVVSLMIYTAFMCALFKLIPVTLTAAGIAGFIISLGLAVDGNILISERLKEELRGGRTLQDAIRTGFSRAWSSIRDSNTSSILTAAILFFFGSSLIQGFALTLGLGAVMSMLSAVTISRIILVALNVRDNKFTRFIFKSGFSK